MSQNWRKIAKMLHNAAKKFDWETTSSPGHNPPYIEKTDLAFQNLRIYKLEHSKQIFTKFLNSSLKGHFWRQNLNSLSY